MYTGTMINAKEHVSMHPPITAAPKYSPLHRHDADMMKRHYMSGTGGNIFGGLDDALLAREALAAVDVSKVNHHQVLNFKNDMTGGYSHLSAGPHAIPTSSSRLGLDHLDSSIIDPISASSLSLPVSMSENTPTSVSHHQHHHMQSVMVSQPHPSMMPHNMPGMHDLDTDPRELEAFAEHFKQRRIKLGVTQSDVGKALGNLKIPGVGSLSQSTICRFESLTLSHNNMIALKPVLSAWLEDAEKQARSKIAQSQDVMSNSDKKRKRTSIAAPEKRSLEAYFAVQPRPSSEKIVAIAEKLDLKKNVVRVWFCNQRQKQKRMKFSAVQTR